MATEKNFVKIANLDYSNISLLVFLEKLEEDCALIGQGNNLGELKTYVLLQFLNHKLGEQIYIFCSDDKTARNGVVSIGNVRCISVLSTSGGTYNKTLPFTVAVTKAFVPPAV